MDVEMNLNFLKSQILLSPIMKCAEVGIVMRRMRGRDWNCRHDVGSEVGYLRCASIYGSFLYYAVGFGLL